jgi:hypothetical protein
LVIYALRKFTGGLGDEDDMDRNNQDWKKYFLKDIGQTKSVISLQKANGEAAHLSCRSFDGGKFLLFIGSKNVHMAIESKSDIEKYSDDRYMFAKIISQSICDFLDKMDADLKQNLLTFLSLTRLTVIFEILNPETQHVEDLSYLKE